MTVTTSPFLLGQPVRDACAYEHAHVHLTSLSASLSWLDKKKSKQFSFPCFQFDAEFRRFALSRDGETRKFDDFYKLLEKIHVLMNIPFIICYTDPNGDLLPINNDDNYLKALTTARPMLRLMIQRKGNLNIWLDNTGHSHQWITDSPFIMFCTVSLSTTYHLVCQFLLFL